MVFYFAYGSNMSQSRMIKRGLIPTNKQIAFLDNYEFLINKRSYKNPKIGYANVTEKKNSVVEGILYEVEDHEILLLDRFEGAPKHYSREILNLRLQDGSIVQGIVYIANFGWTSPRQLKTTSEYKKFILEGKEWISDNYYIFLNESIKV
jgi:gamma-glutamylcyclotransferase (GGCT)/AIG2-like uncharacterized protein YtfP